MRFFSEIGDLVARVKTRILYSCLRFSCFALLFLFLQTPSQSQAQDLSGKWSVEIFQDDILVNVHSWILIQNFIQGVPVINGNGSDAVQDWTITATHVEGRLSLLYNFEGSTFISVYEGPIISENEMSGTWVNSLTNFGTWKATRLESTVVPVSPSTKLRQAPDVIIDKTTATLIFDEFSGVASDRGRSSFVQKVETLAANQVNPNLNFRYDVEIVRKKDGAGKKVKAEFIKKTSKKNILTLKKLKPGEYSARYRVEITKKVGKTISVTGKTKFSPAAGFIIAN